MERLNEYRPIPFWSWNDCLEPEALRRQIRWMNEMGFGGFFMHARGGLQIPYLSEEWMKCIEVCCDEAKKLGMEAWAYDENGWPSGFVGGKLLDDLELRDMYIQYRVGTWDKEADISYQLSGDTLVRIHNEEDTGECLNLYLCKSASSVDILNPKTVERFLQETHEKYKRYFGNAFSGNLSGFFTDEPQYYRWQTPYTPMVAKYFEEEYGEDIKENLGLLFVEKKGYRRFRYRYWLAMQKLMLESYAKGIYEWCENQGVRLTGHYVEEVSMGFQIMCCGGVMPFYEYEHVPGIDWLGQDTDNELSPRQLGSAARQLGKKQTLSETFGCCGWDVTPGELRRIAGFQYACGVNRVCHHLVPYSERGQRKRDYPTHFHPVNPWTDRCMKDFNDYIAKLGCLLGEGDEPVNVAMLHPIRSAYFDYKRGTDAYGGEFAVKEQDEKLREECRYLSSRGIAYHFLDETLLERHGFVEDDHIGCGECTYTYLILPSMQTMGAHTEKLLRRFIDAGGKVLLMDDKPGYLEGDPFDYSYLESNCTFQELEEAQPFRMKNVNTELYCTYRTYGKERFLFVQNASGTESYTQEFLFADDTRSFRSLDLTTMEWEKKRLTVTLPPNGVLLLFPSEEEAPSEEKKQEHELVFEQAKAEFTTNFLTIDTVRYSKDGKAYSEPLLCRTLFRRLLEERYEGPLWLSYDFHIEELPEELTLFAEKEQYTESSINGRPFVFTEPTKEEASLWRADVTNLVQTGWNSFETKTDWYQSEKTYYALFGENVTENLRNCIVYHSEIEAVYLAGHFGVYSVDGFTSYDAKTVCASRFTIGKAPKLISEPTVEGFPFFRGELTLRQKIQLPQKEILLKLPGHYLTAVVKVNGNDAGELLFDRQLDISSFAVEGENEVEVTFCLGNRNLLGPLHYSGPEGLITHEIFEKCDLLNEEDGTPKYRFYRFYPEKFVINQIKTGGDKEDEIEKMDACSCVCGTSYGKS